MTLARYPSLSSAIQQAAFATFVLSAMTGAKSDAQSSKRGDVPSPQVVETYRQLPLSFEANRGQVSPGVKFLSGGEGYSLFLTDSEAVLAFGKSAGCAARANLADRAGQQSVPFSTACEKKRDVMRMSLSGASKAAGVAGEAQLPGKVNYFIGNDPAKWRAGLPTYAKVHYSGVYPGVDLIYYGNQRQLEYDFVVAPGANPAAIRLNFSGQTRLTLAANGDLTLRGENSSATLRKPTVYQEKDGQRQPVAGSFQLAASHTVHFALGSYDRTRPLIIDPVLVYSSYLGGSGGDSGNAIAVDSDGNAYVVGSTDSADFPVTNAAYQTSNKSLAAGHGGTIFITKFNPTGTALIFSTYLGGSGLAAYNPPYGSYGPFGDSANAVSLDAAHNVYLTGSAYSADFPVTTGAFQTVKKTVADGTGTAFVTKLNAAGNALIYSTYLGGTHVFQCSSYKFINEEQGNSIAVDGQGNAFVAGFTTSADFPVTAGALQTTYGASATGGPNGFAAKLNATGTALIYSTYLGGSGSGAQCYVDGDESNAIAIDSFGDAYVAGHAASPDFPVTTGAFQTTNKAGEGSAFVTELNPEGSAEVYSTYLGGTVGDWANALVLNSEGEVYVAGNTDSPDFPVTAGVVYPSEPPQVYGYVADGFVAKLNASGSALVYSTHFGGYTSYIKGLAVDSTGSAYIAGEAILSDVPTTPDAVEPDDQLLTVNTLTAAYVAKLNPTATGIVYSSMLGYGGSANAVALDSADDLYVTGSIFGNDLPTSSGAYQTANNGNQDAFAAKLALAGDTTVHSFTTAAINSSSALVNVGQMITLTAKVTGAAGSTTPGGSVSFAITGAAGYSSTATLNASGIATWTITLQTTGVYAATVFYAGDDTHLSSQAGGASFRAVGPPAAISPYGQVDFTYSYGTGYSPLGFVVSDAAGYGLKGVTVNISGPGLTFSPPGATTTDANGYGSFFPSAPSVGTYVATASVTGVPSVVTYSITVLPVPLTVTIQFTSNQRYYGAANPKFTYLIHGLVNGDTAGGTVVVNIQDPATTSSPVGSYPITATISGPSAPDYALTVKGATLNVLPVRLSIEATNYTSQYGQTPPAPTAYTFFGFVNGDTTSVVSGAPALSTTATATSTPGSYLISVGIGTLTATNYTFKPGIQAGYLQILPAPLTVNVLPASSSRLYGAANPAFTYSAAGLVNGDTVTITPSTTATPASPVGPYPVTAAVGGAAAAKYKITVNNAALTVTPAPLTVSVLPATASRTYGAGNPTFTYAATGLVNGDTLTPSTTATPASPVGTYPVTVTGAALSNYSPTIHTATLTVKPAALSLAATSYKSTYGQTPPAPTAYTLTGFVNGDTSSVVSGAPALSTTATAASPVGYYPIQVGVGSLSAANYTFAVKGPQANLGITKAPLTLKADNLTMPLGGPIPALTYSFAGLANGDTAATAVTGVPGISTTATTHSKAGTYAIYANLGTVKSANYVVTTANGVMTVLP